MPYLLIEDFKFGMDRRRERISGIPGTLWTGKNVHITRGGDIQRTKKFVSRFTLPAGSHGLATLGEQLYVFDETDLSATMPAGVNFQRLQHPASGVMTRILDAKPFDGLMYAIAEFDDGSVYHYYNGSRVTGWDTVAAATMSFNITARVLADKLSEDGAIEAEAYGSTILITATTPGTAFTIAKATADAATGTSVNDQDITLTEEQANVAAVAEVRATGTVTVTGGTTFTGVNVIDDITVDGTSLLAAPVSWVSSNSATAAALVTAINNSAETSGYTATSVGAVVTIKAAAGTGATPNGFVVAVDIPATSNVTATPTNMAGGVTAVAAVAQVYSAALSGTLGTDDAGDQFTVTINGTNYRVTHRGAATGTSLYVYRGRVYSPVASIVRYCQINDPTDWTTTTTSADAGFFNVSQDSSGAEVILALANYNNLTAVFSADNIYIYSLSADNSLNNLVTVIENSGTPAPRSVLAYGNRDVFYLDATGIRSIQARDSSGDASVDDVGTVVDTFVQGYVATLDESKPSRAVAAIEPGDNLFMLLLGGRVFTLSRYPRVKISAWTYIERSEALTELARTSRRLYARDATKIYLYGGIDSATYDDDSTAVPVVELPFVSARDEAGIKMFTGMDLACVGEWEVKVLPDPNDDTKEWSAGVFRRNTYHLSHPASVGRSSHFAVKLAGKSAGRLSLSSLALHYEKEERR